MAVEATTDDVDVVWRVVDREEGEIFAFGQLKTSGPGDGAWVLYSRGARSAVFNRAALLGLAGTCLKAAGEEGLVETIRQRLAAEGPDALTHTHVPALNDSDPDWRLPQ